MRIKLLIAVLIFLMICPFVLGADISGYVIDYKDNLLKHTPVKIFCEDKETQVLTDDLGFFKFSNFSGECKLVAIYEGKFSEKSIFLNSSKNFISLKIPLETNSNSLEPLTILFLIMLVIGVFLVVKYKILSKNKKEIPAQVKGMNENIMQTLTDKEKLVAQQLIKGPLTQSQLRHYTGLPKSSLHRVLSKLEQRNLVIEQEEAGIKKWCCSDLLEK